VHHVLGVGGVARRQAERKSVEARRVAAVERAKGELVALPHNSADELAVRSLGPIGHG